MTGEVMANDIATMEQNVRNLAANIEARIYEAYSGRGMMGKTCLGIVCDDPADVLEAFREYDLPRPNRDNMGRQYICYWPDIPSK